MEEKKVSDVLLIINRVNTVFDEYFKERSLDYYNMIEFIQKFDSYKDRLVATACMLTVIYDPVSRCYGVDSTDKIAAMYYKLKKYNKKHKIRLFIDVKFYYDDEGYLNTILYHPTLKPANYKEVVQGRGNRNALENMFY